ncbi:MAG: NUDIX domain-containing protein [Gemmobacter sp.]
MGRAALELTATPLFLWGPHRHLPLLRAVLGRDPAVVEATLPGYRVSGRDRLGLVPETGPGVTGLLVEATEADRERLAFHGNHTAWARRPVRVAGQTAAVMAMASTGQADLNRIWRFEDWLRRDAALAVAMAPDIMALMGRRGADEVAGRRHAMEVRASSRLRAAADPVPARLRRQAGAGDVAVAAFDQPYARFFAVEEFDLSFRRFDGAMSATVNRAVFISGDAVTVLPYDPVRDRVLVIEQFRAGPFARGDGNPWSLEAIAGRIDPGETAEAAGRREAREEAGLRFGELLPVANYYPSPGGKSEYLYSYVALADLPDDAARLGGVEDEAEDIRGHVIGFDRMMDLVASGEIGNAPLILSALWLQRERGRLRAGLTHVIEPENLSESMP